VLHARNGHDLHKHKDVEVLTWALIHKLRTYDMKELHRVILSYEYRKRI